MAKVETMRIVEHTIKLTEEEFSILSDLLVEDIAGIEWCKDHGYEYSDVSKLITELTVGV